MSYPSCYGRHMRVWSDERDSASLLAAFGDARLMHYLDGRLDLVGGSDEDRRAALGWLARFMPGVRLGQPKPLPWARRT